MRTRQSTIRRTIGGNTEDPEFELAKLYHTPGCMQDSRTRISHARDLGGEHAVNQKSKFRMPGIDQASMR